MTRLPMPSAGKPSVPGTKGPGGNPAALSAIQRMLMYQILNPYPQDVPARRPSLSGALRATGPLRPSGY